MHAELKPELPIPNGTLATLQHFAPKLLSEEIRVFFTWEGKTKTSTPVVHWVKTSNKISGKDDGRPKHKVEEPSNQQLKQPMLTLIRKMADELHKNHHPIWANMNDLPMRCDIFKHTDVNGKTQFLINKFGMVTMEDMHSTDYFTHEHCICALAKCVVDFLKDNFGKGL